MTVELDIENQIVEYLQQKLPAIKIEANDADLSVLILKALGESKGLIVVSHDSRPDEYNNASENDSRSILTERYVISIFSKDRRGREGMYDSVDKIRTAMSGFVYRRTAKAKLTGHLFSPQKFPDIIDGVFVGDVYVQFKLQYPFQQHILEQMDV